jgi:fucose 4-O-acetylase-like acetyltransferase
MYFLMSLFLLRLASHLWARLSKAGPGTLLMVFASYTLLFHVWLREAYLAHVQLPGLDPILHALWGLQFLLGGIAWVAVETRARPHAGWIAAAATSGAVAASLASLSAVLGQMAYLVALVSAATAFAGRPVALAWLGRRTMAVYLLHTPVCMQGAVFATRGLSSAPLARLAVIAILAFTSALVLGEVLRRVALGRVALGEPRSR